jgi:hypothetical protein
MKKLILVLCLGLIVSLSYAQVQPQKQTQTQPQKQTQVQTQKPQPVKSNRTPIKVTDLPKPITDSIAANYSGYKTLEAYKIDNKGVFTYQVIIAKDANKLQLYYDKDGKLLRKAAVPVKQTTTATTPVKTTTTPVKTTVTPAKTTTTNNKAGDPQK